MKKFSLIFISSIWLALNAISPDDYKKKMAQELDLQRVTNITQELAQHYQASQSKDIYAIIENALTRMPLKVMGLSDDEVNQILAQKLPANARTILTTSVPKALTTFRTLRFYLLPGSIQQNMTALSTGLAPVLTKQNLTEPGYQALTLLLAYAKSNDIKLQDIATKMVELIDTLGKYIKENIGSEKQIKALADDQLLQKLQQIIKLEQPLVQQLLPLIKRLELPKLKEFLEQLQKIDFKKINFADIQKQLAQISPPVTTTTTTTTPTTPASSATTPQTTGKK